MICPKCKNKALIKEPTGHQCIICGNFIYNDSSNLRDCWLQFRINAQYPQQNTWGSDEYPINKSWALIEEIDPILLPIFKEYAGV